MILTRNDLTVAVALPQAKSYSQLDDQIFSDFQNSDTRGPGDSSGDELTPVRQLGRAGACGQNFTPRRLCRFSWAGTTWMAPALGRGTVSLSCPIRNRHRNGTTSHGGGANGLLRRYSRQSFGRGARPHNFPYFLDTTSTLRRSFPCVA